MVLILAISNLLVSAQFESIRLQERIGFEKTLNHILQSDLGEMYVSLVTYVKSDCYTGCVIFDAVSVPYIYHIYINHNVDDYQFNEHEFGESVRFFKKMILNRDTMSLPALCDTLLQYDIFKVNNVDSILHWNEENKYEFIADAFDENGELKSDTYDVTATIAKMFEWGYFIAWDVQAGYGRNYVFPVDMLFREYIMMDSFNLAIYQSLPTDTICILPQQFKIEEDKEECIVLKIIDKDLFKKISDATFPVLHFENKRKAYWVNGYFQENTIIYDNPYCTYPCDEYNKVVFGRDYTLHINIPQFSQP